MIYSLLFLLPMTGHGRQVCTVSLPAHALDNKSSICTIDQAYVQGKQLVSYNLQIESVNSIYFSYPHSATLWATHTLGTGGMKGGGRGGAGIYIPLNTTFHMDTFTS